MSEKRDEKKPVYRVNVRWAPTDCAYCAKWEVTLPEIKQTTRCVDLSGARAAAEKIVASAMGVGLGDFSLGPVVQVVDDGEAVVDLEVLEHHFTTWTRVSWGHPEGEEPPDPGKRLFRVDIRQSDGLWAITVPDLPGVYSQAAWLAGVVEAATDAIALFLDVDLSEVGVSEVWHVDPVTGADILRLTDVVGLSDGS